ncbi:MAG: cytochrome c [Gemmatimonadetes bacterium]|nr:cytochrome c [Gemmatimonadota bacterium]
MLVGCAGPADAPGTPADESFADIAYALPEQAPRRFGFGAEASAARVARWDTDVKPDGEGLPAGKGTVAEGEVVFMTYCVACHGPTGTEGPNDVLVGSDPWEAWPGSVTVGGYWPYATTLYDYISRAMPQLTPGVLTPNQTYAVIAYILHRNGVVAADAEMDAQTLPAVIMPARDRFVVDDRQGGSQIR